MRRCKRKGVWCQLFHDKNMTWLGGELISLVGGRQQMKINSIHLIRRNSGQALASADVLMAVTGTKWLQLSWDNKRQIATSAWMDLIFWHVLNKRMLLLISMLMLYYYALLLYFHRCYAWLSWKLISICFYLWATHLCYNYLSTLYYFWENVWWSSKKQNQMVNHFVDIPSGLF